MSERCCATCLHFDVSWSGCMYEPPLSLVEALRAIAGDALQIDGGFVSRPNEYVCSAWTPSTPPQEPQP